MLPPDLGLKIHQAVNQHFASVEGCAWYFQDQVDHGQEPSTYAEIRIYGPRDIPLGHSDYLIFFAVDILVSAVVEDSIYDPIDLASRIAQRAHDGLMVDGIEECFTPTFVVIEPNGPSEPSSRLVTTQVKAQYQKEVTLNG